MTWRILVVDDEELIANLTRDALQAAPVSASGDRAEVTVENDFEAALSTLEEGRFDLIVLDVRDQSRTGVDRAAPTDMGSEVTTADSGVTVFEAIRSRRFVPVVFYTALPDLVAGMDEDREPFVAVVSKLDPEPINTLRMRVREIFDSMLPSIHRALLAHVDDVIRDFMANFVEPHWADLSSPDRRGDLTHLLLRRLALSLADGGESLKERLGSTTVQIARDNVHPMRFYVVPPVGGLTTGDIVRVDSAGDPGDHSSSGRGQEGSRRWYVVLTPACDLVEPRVKADFVVLAECVTLQETPEYQAWMEAVARGERVETAERKLRRLMENNAEGRPRDRNLYLPAAWDIPDLLVDFQRVRSVPRLSALSFQRVATLDSPYAEALVNTFNRYLSRVGTPDLNVDIPVARLRPS